jgi:hypothetical protein
VDHNCKNEVAKMIKIFRAIKNDKEIDQTELDKFIRAIGYDPYEIARKFIKNNIAYSFQQPKPPGLRKISLKSTTVESSKGLAADYVFITHFDNQYFIENKDKDKITDHDICKFLVALTRAKRKVFLISSDCNEEPIFLKWINQNRIDKLPPSVISPK